MIKPLTKKQKRKARQAKLKSKSEPMEQNQTEIYEIIKEKFPTPDDVFSDKYFREEAEKVMTEIVIGRQERKPPPEGKVYKRDWIDTFLEKGISKNNYLDELELVLLKKSTMSANIRGQLQYIIGHCMNVAAQRYHNEREKA